MNCKLRNNEELKENYGYHKVEEERKRIDLVLENKKLE